MTLWPFAIGQRQFVIKGKSDQPACFKRAGRGQWIEKKTKNLKINF
jgi:hypothetical protein